MRRPSRSRAPHNAPRPDTRRGALRIRPTTSLRLAARLARLLVSPMAPSLTFSSLPLRGVRVARVVAAAGARAPRAVPSLPLTARGLCAVSAAADGAAAATVTSSNLPAASDAAAGMRVTNFYHLVPIPNARATRKAHERVLTTLDVRGRIYISPQGINAQFSAPQADTDAYVAWVAAQPGFEGITPNTEVAPGGEHLYPKLRLKYKPCLISLAGGHGELPVTDPAARATPLTPGQWAAMLPKTGTADADPSTSPIVLDVRNAYEWDAGHFEGAGRPVEVEFNETPTDATAAAGGPALPPHLAAADPATTPVMMYCTGGIRCDIYSAYLKKKGFEKLYTLEGGVHRYFKEQGGAGWNGSLFVFDARMAVAPDGGAAAGGDEGSPPLAAAAPCARCGAPATLPHLNCANIDCNDLFLSCDACKSATRGCCCESCMSAPRLLRPAKTSGHYGTWATEAAAVGSDGDALAAAAARLSIGRGDGRLARRRARAARLRARGDAQREERQARKETAKAALKSREEDGEGDGEDRGQKLARLRELRERVQRDQGGAAAATSV